MARDTWDKKEKWEFSYTEKEECKGQGGRVGRLCRTTKERQKVLSEASCCLAKHFFAVDFAIWGSVWKVIWRERWHIAFNSPKVCKAYMLTSKLPLNK